KRVTTQISHLVMSMIAVFKLECLKIKHHLNHFALRAKILIKANLAAMAELKKLRCA
ncbi:MAG: IS701 family transposase, partial [Deltaproteobacteria bacterium]